MGGREMTFNFQDYLRMASFVERQAEKVAEGEQPDEWEFGDDDTCMFVYEGELVAKERPRKGNNGKFFTPKRTRDFEKAVAEWGKLCLAGRDPFPYPIRVRLHIYEPTMDPDKVLHSQCGLTYAVDKDIDNFAKSILDGLNGVMWKDDGQLCDLNIVREFSHEPRFGLMVARAGLSRVEYQNFLKVWNNRERYRGQNTG